jgi:hypothetical protein
MVSVVHLLDLWHNEEQYEDSQTPAGLAVWGATLLYRPSPVRPPNRPSYIHRLPRPNTAARRLRNGRE